jgi:ribosomal protein L7/L12
MNFSDYYQSHKNYFWVWEEDAEVLSISGGSTIAFREQVAEILIGIGEQGLPPFGSFLLAMVATNKTIDNSLQFVQDSLIAYITKAQKSNLLNGEIIDEAFTFLKTLSKIPQEYKTGKRRQILLQTIFAQSHNRLNAATSKGIAAGLKTNIHGRSRLLRQKEFTDSVFLKDFRVIGLLIRNFPTVQSIIDGMGDLPELEESELPLLEDITTENSSYGDFTDELMSNPHTFHTGALIKTIWAGFNIPIFNTHPSEQPLGGVSDLSNKGNFDKLLVSEFANDDIVFMNRIANSEALYLHREMPPVKDKLHRTILIDISLKNWGTPKILAYASYIAIAKHPKALSESKAFVVGNNFAPVSCNAIAEVIDGLQKVDAGLHAGKGLAAFLEANKQDQQLEIFYITTANALKYPEVQQQLAMYSAAFKYIITTDAAGEIDFYRRKNNTQKHLQTIRLPLEKLWKKKIVTQQEEIVIVSPKIFVPLLLPTPNQIKKVMPLGETEIYCVADRRLLRRNLDDNKKADKGWELVLKNVLASGHFEIGKLKNDQVVFLSFNPQNRELQITNTDTLQSAKTNFIEWKGKKFKEFLFNRYQQFMYLVSNPDAFAFNPNFETGIIEIEKLHLTSNIFGLDYPNRQKQINEFPGIYSNTKLLRNISDVYINQENYLVFNTHQLHVAHGEQLYFSSYGINNFKAVKAERSSNKREFTFKDGSKILVDASGYINLISSNSDMPEIYFTSLLETPLGMATQRYFAGNEFFYDNTLGQVSVTLTTVGATKLMAIKIIKNYTGLGLAEAKHIVDESPQLITKNMDFEHAKKMAQELTEIDCATVIGKTNHAQQTIIAVNTFYQQNIAKFIGHIINYAPAN